MAAHAQRSPTASSTPRDPLVNARLLFHTIVAVLSWGLFGYYWWLVSQRRVTSETVQALQMLALLIGIIWAATTLWIHHNRRQHATRPERRLRRRSLLTLPQADALGQPVDIEGPVALEHAAYLELRVDPETGSKHITTFTHAPQTQDHPGEITGGAA